MARAAAEEEQSDHFEKKHSPEEELPLHVLAQNARLVTYTNELKAYVQRCMKYMQTTSDCVHAGKYQQECLTVMVQFLPEWGQDKDYQMKHAVYKKWYGITQDTIKLPAGPIFRAPMETAGLDGRFSDGDADAPPPKRAKGLSPTELFPPTGNERKHPPSVTNVDGKHNDHTLVKLNIDQEKTSQTSPLQAMCDSTTGPKLFKVKLVQAGAEFLPSPKNLIPPSNASKAYPTLPSP